MTWSLVFILILDSSAENFMTGYRVVFDREKLVLGWKKFDRRLYFCTCSNCQHLHNMASLSDQTCFSNAGYDTENYNILSTEPHASMAPPAVAAGQGSNSSTGSRKETRNDSKFIRISIFPWPYFCFN